MIACGKKFENSDPENFLQRLPFFMGGRGWEYNFSQIRGGPGGVQRRHS
jgi:hypothetical protein